MRHIDITNHIERSHAIKSEAMLIMTSIIRAGKSEFAASAIDEDSLDRILMCLRVLSCDPEEQALKTVFLEKCRYAYTILINEGEVMVLLDSSEALERSESYYRF